MRTNPFTPTTMTVTTANPAAARHFAAQGRTFRLQGPSRPDPVRRFAPPTRGTVRTGRGFLF